MIVSSASNQRYRTPPDFLAAVVRRFGPLAHDLAAEASSAVAPRWFGPGSPLAEDSLVTPWDDLEGNLWLNPPFKRITPWVVKCYHAGVCRVKRPPTQRIFLLVPASVGTNWYQDMVHGSALVLFLRGRLSFLDPDAAPDAKRNNAFFPCLLAVYGVSRALRRCETWDWERDDPVAEYAGVA